MSYLKKIRHFFTLGLLEDCDNTSSNRIFTINIFSLIGGLLFLIFGIVDMITISVLMGVILIATAFILAGNIAYLRISNNYKISGHIVSSLVGVVFMYLFISGGVDGTGYLWVITYPLVTVSISGQKNGRIYSIVFLLVSIAVFLLPDSQFYSYKAAFILRFIAAYMFVYFISCTREYITKKAKTLLETRIMDSRNENKIKEEFISKLSHQIRTPLNNIMVVSNILKGFDINEKQKDLLDTIVASTNNLVDAVNNIGKITNIEIDDRKHEKINFDLHSTIESTLNLFSSKEESNIIINLNYPQKLDINLIGDPIRIKQIFMNLIENIITDRSDNKVNIDINIETKKEDKNMVTILFKVIVNRLVEQTVEGGTKKYFFNDILQTPEQKYIDMGIVRKLLNLTGDKLNIHPKSEETHFEFSISFKKVSIAREEENVSEAPQLQSSKKPTKKVDLKNADILLVEDNLINQKIVNLSLKKVVKNVDIANNGKEALDKFGTKKYDLILMDIQMPVMDGITATKKIREIEASTNSHTPIIAITAYALSGDKENCLAAGMNDYISKPFQIEDLLERMKQLLSPS